MCSMVMVRWREHGAWCYMATDSMAVLEKFSQSVEAFEYVS